MTAIDIHNGVELAANEAIVWRGRPAWRSLARDVLHLRGIAAYLVFLVGLDAYQAWTKAIPLTQALHDSVPLLVIEGIVLANVVGFAWLIGRTTRYTITDRRVILDYGVAIPATLSLPFARLESVAVSVKADHSGDIPLGLRSDDRMPYLKLWPHARPWHVSKPQPMLRCVPQAGIVAALLSNAVGDFAHGAKARSLAARAPREKVA